MSVQTGIQIFQDIKKIRIFYTQAYHFISVIIINLIMIFFYFSRNIASTHSDLRDLHFIFLSIQEINDLQIFLTISGPS